MIGRDRIDTKLYNRIQVFRIIIVAIFIMFFLRLFYLQIISGKRLLKVSEDNRVQLFFNPAPRGTIFDRNHNIIVRNRASFAVYFSPINLSRESLDYVLARLSSILSIELSDLKKRVEENLRNPFCNLRLVDDVDRHKVFFISENRNDLPGVSIKVEPVRLYPYNNFASHLLGYLGEINKKELQSLSHLGYQLGDTIGKMGIEGVYDKWLRGRRGLEKVEIDAQGRQLRLLDEVPPKPGYNLILTLDFNLQRISEDLLRDKQGVICVLNPQDGSILAMVSKPDYNPNVFCTSLTREDCSRLFNDPLNPILNRALQGQYAPGSSFKVITAVAGLEEEKITLDTKFNCPGFFQQGDRTFRCWKEEGHGKVDIIEGIAQSCDVFFYRVGLEVGIDDLSSYARIFGLGRPTQISLGSEANGLVPDREWKRKHTKQIWFPGDTVNVAIGQGYLLTTPLQMANLTATIANGGKIFRPFVVRKIITQEGETVESYFGKQIGEAHISHKTLEIVRRGMEQVVESGTGRAAAVSGIKIAGKTGTAENPQGEDHAWFLAYAPSDKDPEIALAVFVEHGGHGAQAAAPLARKILEGFFK